MIDPSTIYLAAGVLLLCGLLAGAMATGRRRDGAVWFLAGLVFGPFAVVALLFFGGTSYRD